MPEISRFLGIVIKMYHDDHPPPHIHAEYGEHRALIHIETFDIIAGHLPSRSLGLVREWALLHQRELREFWSQAQDHQPLGKIEPLE